MGNAKQMATLHRMVLMVPPNNIGFINDIEMLKNIPYTYEIKYIPLFLKILFVES